MTLIFIVGFVLLLAFFLLSSDGTRRARKNLEQIRSGWGKPKNEPFHFEGIGTYAGVVHDQPFHRLSEQTLNDLDFQNLFRFLDRTIGKVGQQFLYKKLMEPSDRTSDPSQPLITLLTEDRELREAVQMQLIQLNHPDAYHIPALLQDKLLESPSWLKFLKFDILVVVLLLPVSFKFPVFSIALLLIFAFNLLLHYWNKTNSYPFLRSFPQLNTLVNVARVLSKMEKLPADKAVEWGIDELRPFQRKLNLLNFDNKGGIKGEIEQVMMYLVEMLKGFLLIEVFTLFRLTKELESRQASIIMLFNYVGHIDACISVASLRAGELKTCLPELTDGGEGMILKNIYHPLIEDCVTNDLNITEKSILITGSNMSGKSTFLRTLCINSVLAQTIYTCFGELFVSPVLKQYSSIRIDDDLFEGKSYYFEEVRIMGTLIAEVETPFQNLFVLDEVFKGTNTVERIASAKAILSYLNRKNNIAIVATHDIELSDMLKDEYELYHFTEMIEEEELIFDHKIKPGPLKTRNAIRLLELSNYPAEIIREAKEILQGGKKFL
ncbi:DNA mismatch repair protein MutS [Emticicia sp. CRIBPO]|uniref:MutS-related protein n=1 Tax=Emticicia sp. CRIBPO TaxID=2683258 RepID=UPI00141365E6|nr:DNA mismatch repair protein MutS [Emticicia sp. CRIBPO]NBA85543.1 DNA mismatch repair protein MutS [Emticicia sp. CRIBPO]